MKRIVVDAGHGDHDPGAVSPLGLKEADVALDVALQMEGFLVGLFDVAYTRRDDTFLSLTERAEFANDRRADLFISIHCNSAVSNDASGHEVWTSPGQTDSDVAATHAFNSYSAMFPSLKARKDVGDGDPDKEAKFTVLVKTSMPAFLYELEFIHTLEGHKWFSDPGNRTKAALAIANGVRTFFGYPELQEPDHPVVVPPLSKDEEIRLAAQKILELVG